MTSGEVSVKFKIDNYNAAIQQSSSNLMQMDAGVDQVERLETLDAGQDLLLLWTVRLSRSMLPMIQIV
ncbi:hypothetical protein M5F03_02225 [Acinetobacter sp. ANC 5579]|uniref:hypothetical protein n=1 Tax=Acinetobacter amyesii TaxID=2942470 RepID=UPI0020BDBC8A|nr:hypothetical protein [Acinetobacter amyesii]MCL6233993.1 hypothetical protein [Acinetobacter amyesii]